MIYQPPPPPSSRVTHDKERDDKETTQKIEQNQGSHHYVDEVSVPAVGTDRYLAVERQIVSNPGALVSTMLRYVGLYEWVTVGRPG